jgi:hypothetical protein
MHFLSIAAPILGGEQGCKRTGVAIVCCSTTRPESKRPASTVEFRQSMSYESPSRPQDCGTVPPGRTDQQSGLSRGSARITICANSARAASGRAR